ncbi:asparagine synthase-domain-containing protein [Amylostereum chailletii]|nr:asparagine synthase-domain-containing protein [Amylostereum chailletii]
MCGIVVSVAWDASSTKEPSEFHKLKRCLQEANKFRGPDSQRIERLDIQNSSSRSFKLECFASELLLRGDRAIVQPHIHPETGDILCWNGEIFQGLDIDIHENDGEKLFKTLTALHEPEDIVELFGTIEGPHAFAYYHSLSQRLFFARDPLGRRSLLIHRPSEISPYFFLASVSSGSCIGYDMAELSTDAIYVLDLKRLCEAHDPTAEFNDCLTALSRVQDSPSSIIVPFAIPEKVNLLIPDPEPPLLESLDTVPDHLEYAVEGLISCLDASVRLRVENIPKPPTPLFPYSPGRLAVLFSGGIDSTMLAFLAHRHVPIDEPIDLLNVAFENPRKIKIQTDGNVGGMSKKERKLRARVTVEADLVEIMDHQHDYLVPDRLTGLQEVEELRRICPGRTWNFVEINIPFPEAQAARERVEAVMWPGRTVMDLSLAMALYFAARGVGQVRSDPSCTYRPYTSSARVLLNGLGSDELLGGYGRHRTAYKSGGWQRVIEELQLEIDRIPIRNMGRDDRVISSHGKETRHPFLSLNVVAFIAGLPVHHKMDPRVEVGLGDKMLLRLVARRLGVVEASGRKKRAMQFGSHSARMEAGTPNSGGALILSLSNQ